MKIFCSVLLIMCLYSCHKKIEFDSKYYKLEIASNYKIDSADYGEFHSSPHSYPDKEILPGSSHIHQYYVSNFTNNDTTSGLGKMIMFNNLVIANDSKLEPEKLFIKLLNKEKELHADGEFGVSKYEIIVFPKDTIINKLHGFYAITQHEYDFNKKALKRSKKIIWLQKEGKIYEFQLMNSDLKMFTTNFKETEEIIKTIVIK